MTWLQHNAHCTMHNAHCTSVLQVEHLSRCNAILAKLSSFSARVQEVCVKCENRVFVPPSVPTQPESKNTAVLKISAKQCHEEHRVEMWSRSCSASLVSHDNGDLHTESESSSTPGGSTPSSSTPGCSAAQFSVQLSWVRAVFKVCSAADRIWSSARSNISAYVYTRKRWQCNCTAVQLCYWASVQLGNYAARSQKIG